jgi:ribonuclease P protein component
MKSAPGAGLVEALCSPAAFQRVLACRPLARTDHFLLHHAAPAVEGQLGAKLSTGTPPAEGQAVDDTAARTLDPNPLPPQRRLGMIVPKRLARRAVTRTLIRRQARVILAQPGLPDGDWVLRLRLEFDRKRFPSAASEALKRCVRAELGGLVDAARQRLAGAAR